MNEFVGRATTEIAIQLLREGKLHDCVACIDRVLQANSDDPLAYSVLGAAYSQIGDHGMAIAAFERSLAEEDSARGHFNLGKAYEEAARVKDAMKQYKIAADMDPAYKMAEDALERLEALLVESAASEAELHQPHMLGGDPA